jgi:hypothetical protein
MKGSLSIDTIYTIGVCVARQLLSLPSAEQYFSSQSFLVFALAERKNEK